MKIPCFNETFITGYHHGFWMNELTAGYYYGSRYSQLSFHYVNERHEWMDVSVSVCYLSDDPSIELFLQRIGVHAMPLFVWSRFKMPLQVLTDSLCQTDLERRESSGNPV
jgi:hypothetical protein